MPAKFIFAKILAAYFSFLVLPSLMHGQCAPEISVISQELSLDYFPQGNIPNNLDFIDVNFDNGNMNDSYNVNLIGSSWQTFGEDFSGITLTGELTIHFQNDNPPPIICEYINGDYFDPLPVELSAFNAHLMENTVFLSWSTELEHDNAGFEIERSFDGDNFERVAFVNGVGESDQKTWYSFEDIGVKNAALDKTVYYRLKQIDYDQTYTYSWIEAVDLKLDVDGFQITKIEGWNNPDRIIKIHFYNPPAIRKVNVLVSTINGQIVEQNSIYPNSGFNFFEMDLSNQKDNMLFISLNNGKEIKVEKLILHSID